MTILSTVMGVSDRVYDNAVKAFIRDPTRPIRLLDFMTLRERQILFFTSLGEAAYDAWLEAQNYV